MRSPTWHPARIIFAGFAFATLLGGVTLRLPISSSDDVTTTWTEAIFTAVSAVCVTGLTVVDTPTHWTPFGQVVILLLIQIGGLGVMTFASVIGLSVMRRLSLRSRLNAVAETKALGLDDVKGLVRGVVRIALLIELVTAIVLTVRFRTGYDYGTGESVWLGVFHAVSSFNNAGFALFSDNMVGFATDPWITLPMCAAIILGGLGFPVLMQLRKHWGRPIVWSMNTRIVVWATPVLLLLGTVLIVALEWNNPRTLGAHDAAGRVLVGFFHSVQARTAGFNSVDIGQMDSATLLGLDALMFIGGGPAGTAGGIKVTTFAVLLFIIVTEVRGDTAVNVFGKRLARSVHRQAITVALLSVALVMAATMALLVLTDLESDQVMFEAVSAFATVGLSTGITPDLPVAGQSILMVLMFVGRLGPITFASALALRERRREYELPQERPIIG